MGGRKSAALRRRLPRGSLLCRSGLGLAPLLRCRSGGLLWRLTPLSRRGLRLSVGLPVLSGLRLPPLLGCRLRLRLAPRLLRSRLRARLAPLALRHRRRRRGRTPALLGIRVGGMRRCARLLDGSPARQAEFVRGLVLSATASADDHAKTPGSTSIAARARQRNTGFSGPSRPARVLPCQTGCAGRTGGRGARHRGKRPRFARDAGSEAGKYAPPPR